MAEDSKSGLFLAEGFFAVNLVTWFLMRSLAEKLRLSRLLDFTCPDRGTYFFILKVIRRGICQSKCHESSLPELFCTVSTFLLSGQPSRKISSHLGGVPWLWKQRVIQLCVS